MKKKFRLVQPKKISRYVALLLMLNASAQLHAQEEDLFDLSLDQLLDVEVITATQHKQKSSSTPANITVITAEQIRKWGIHDFYEAIRLVPGVNVYQSYYGYKHINFRGVQQDLYTNKALILVNGHPTYDSLFGHSQTEFVPIETIERIEVIRGPGSALYGTNAMAGVINIITKQGGGNQAEVTGRAGSDGYYYAQGQFMGDQFTIAASTRDDDGYDYSGTLDEQGNPYERDLYLGTDNIFLDVFGDSWRFNAAFFDLNQAKMGTTPVNYSKGQHENQSYYLDLSKSFDVLDGQLKFWLRYDNLDMSFYSEAFPCPPGAGGFIPGTGCSAGPGPFDDPYKHFTQVERTTFETQFKNKINESLDYILGAAYEKHESDPFVFESLVDGSISPISAYPNNSPEYENLALYGQLQYVYNDQWSGVMGLRWEDNDDSGASDLIPRLGVVYRYTDDTSFKFLYGEAFRSATFIEKYVDSAPALSGNPSLDRETIKTYEVAVESKINATNSITLAAYYLDVEDEIRRVNSANGPIYQNTDGREMYGIELQWVSRLSDQLNLTLNSTYKDGEEKELGEGVYFSNFDLTAILDYRFNENWRASLINNYVGSNDYLLNNGQKGDVDAYNLTDIHLAYQTGGIEISTEIKNLFDEDYELPEPARRNIAEIPGGPERSFYLTMRYAF